MDEQRRFREVNQPEQGLYGYESLIRCGGFRKRVLDLLGRERAHVVGGCCWLLVDEG